MKVKIYSTATCPWCMKTKEFLTQHKVKFQVIDVGKDEKALEEMMEKTGQRGVPVIDIDGQIIIGFDEHALKKALKIK